MPGPTTELDELVREWLRHILLTKAEGKQLRLAKWMGHKGRTQLKAYLAGDKSKGFKVEYLGELAKQFEQTPAEFLQELAYFAVAKRDSSLPGKVARVAVAGEPLSAPHANQKARKPG